MSQPKIQNKNLELSIKISWKGIPLSEQNVSINDDVIFLKHEAALLIGMQLEKLAMPAVKEAINYMKDAGE